MDNIEEQARGFHSWTLLSSPRQGEEATHRRARLWICLAGGIMLHGDLLTHTAVGTGLAVSPRCISLPGAARSSRLQAVNSYCLRRSDNVLFYSIRPSAGPATPLTGASVDDGLPIQTGDEALAGAGGWGRVRGGYWVGMPQGLPGAAAAGPPNAPAPNKPDISKLPVPDLSTRQTALIKATPTVALSIDHGCERSF